MSGKPISLEGLRTRLNPDDLNLSGVIPEGKFMALHVLAGCPAAREQYTGDYVPAGRSGTDGLEVTADVIVRECLGEGSIKHRIVTCKPYYNIPGIGHFEAYPKK